MPPTQNATDPKMGRKLVLQGLILFSIFMAHSKFIPHFSYNLGSHQGQGRNGALKLVSSQSVSPSVQSENARSSHTNVQTGP
jgi:hypothetical protein